MFQVDGLKDPFDMKTNILTRIIKRIWVFLFRKTILGSWVVSQAEKKTKTFNLTEWEESILRDLQSDGIASFNIDILLNEGDRDQIFEHVNTLTQAKPKKSIKTFFEYFIGGYFPEKEQIFNQKDPLFNLAVNESILKIINNYLRAKSKLCYVELNRTLVQPGREKQLSQKAHRDPGLHKCIKAFIYYNDVTETDGPFHFLPRTNITGELGHVVPNFKNNAGSFYLKAENEDLLSDQKPKICTGAKGTVILCDTTGWHFGGSSEDKPRIMSTFVYYPTFEIIQSRLKYDGYVSELSELQSSFLKTPINAT